MNYYDRHLGDYARDTAHLTMIEHGAYTLLLDRYYATEEGIPADKAHRIARARTAPEREAVDAVLAEFFTLQDGVWRQRRADAVIETYREGDSDREAKRENAKERQRRARARRSELFEQLRAASIVPPWDTSTSELERMLSRVPSQPVTPPVTRDDTATHSPDTKPISQQELLPTAAADAAPSPGAKAADPIWHTGLAMLIRKGVPEEQARKFVGKLKRECGDITAAALLADAEADDITEPIPWLATAARNAKARAANPKPSAADNFTGKTYTGTPIDDLPPDIRDAVRAELAATGTH